MTTPTLPEAASNRPVPALSSAQRSHSPGERVGVLALAAPLLLFVNGILRWVDAVTTLGDPGSPPPHTPLDYAAGSIGAVATVMLAASVLAFGWLAVEVLRHPGLSQRLSAVNLVVATLGVLAIALPFGLLPLGALLVLVGLAPLMRGLETAVARA